MKVYHYSDMDYWYGIKNGSYKSRNQPGLGASRTMGNAYPDALDTGAIFALLEPLPDSWRRNKVFPESWERLKGSIGNVLLEVEVDPKEDKVFIVDRGYVEGFLKWGAQKMSDKYKHESKAEAEKAYMESMIPMEEYLKREAVLNYQLPEVVILNNIPLDRIRISEDQPLLEEDINSSIREIVYEDLRRHSKNIPEIDKWIKKHNYDIQAEDSAIHIRGEK